MLVHSIKCIWVFSFEGNVDWALGPSFILSLLYYIPCLVPTTHFISTKLQGLMDRA